ncbi:MAG: V-type ATP synthase subunit E [Gammaproteobacteria bacterium]|jgi:V/A-type H+/Na+-transporting ATPase subunit E
MSSEPSLQDLEQALIDRARRLADEYMARARSTRERMISDKNEWLRIREEREVFAAELASERFYRSKVQSTEMELQGELDRRRWEMVQDLKLSIRQEFLALMESREYVAVLKRFLSSAVAALHDEGELVAHLAQRDLERFGAEWPQWLQETAPGSKVMLSGEAGHFTGGLLIRNRDDSVRVDHSFEGRMERLEEQINLVLTAELFPSVAAAAGVSADD